MAWSLLPPRWQNRSQEDVPHTARWPCWAVMGSTCAEPAPLSLQSCLRSCGVWTSSWRSCTSEWAGHGVGRVVQTPVGTLQAVPQPHVSPTRHLDSSSSERPDISSIKRRIQVMTGAPFQPACSSASCSDPHRGGHPKRRWVPPPSHCACRKSRTRWTCAMGRWAASSAAARARPSSPTS